MEMAYSRLLVITLLLLFCFAVHQVSSDAKINDHQPSHSWVVKGPNSVQVSSDAKINDHHPSHSLVVKGPNRRLLPFINCGVRCSERCKLHSRPKICLRACGTCCERCKCVPPGTYGHREMCGRCYTDMLTHDNKPKCP
ncbi:hypothetical protein QN277_028730 [Acacia crassicarpa]|uniref:Uncharacterized protein n=1 Tax=Acacia crassicarpa TaxID=499986 RepID=A0AAE1J3X7_9FABA|nr:hypothetical protein QN277_028730 [Acacia crassicarpa]